MSIYKIVLAIIVAALIIWGVVAYINNDNMSDEVQTPEVAEEVTEESADVEEVSDEETEAEAE